MESMKCWRKTEKPVRWRKAEDLHCQGLLARADIIFQDEAFANLDSRVAREIEKTLLGLEGVTVVNVSHVIFNDTRGKYDRVFIVKNKAVV